MGQGWACFQTEQLCDSAIYEVLSGQPTEQTQSQVRRRDIKHGGSTEGWWEGVNAAEKNPAKQLTIYNHLQMSEQIWSPTQLPLLAGHVGGMKAEGKTSEQATGGELQLLY